MKVRASYNMCADWHCEVRQSERWLSGLKQCRQKLDCLWRNLMNTESIISQLSPFLIILEYIILEAIPLVIR